MKKKIKDLTIEQFVNNCRKKIFCTGCPFNNRCDKEALLTKNKDYLESEIEVNE